MQFIFGADLLDTHFLGLWFAALLLHQLLGSFTYFGYILAVVAVSEKTKRDTACTIRTTHWRIEKSVARFVCVVSLLVMPALDLFYSFALFPNEFALLVQK